MRAYLTYETTFPNKTQLADQLANHYVAPCVDFSVEVQNMGNTPAYHVSPQFWGDPSAYFVGDRALVVPDVFELGPHEARTLNGTICYHEVSAQKVPVLIANLSGAVNFRDAFDNSYTTDLCYSVFIGEDPPLRTCGNEEVKTSQSDLLTEAMRYLLRPR